jgi:hypothetical protein
MNFYLVQLNGTVNRTVLTNLNESAKKIQIQLINDLGKSTRSEPKIITCGYEGCKPIAKPSSSKTGAIVGSLFGVLIAILLVGSAFYLKRYSWKKSFKNIKFFFKGLENYLLALNYSKNQVQAIQQNKNKFKWIIYSQAN